MGKTYTFRHLGGPSDGRTEQRHLSREEFFSYLDRVPKKDAPAPKLRPGEQPHYELVEFKGDTFYFEWLARE